MPIRKGGYALQSRYGRLLREHRILTILYTDNLFHASNRDVNEKFLYNSVLRSIYACTEDGVYCRR